MLLAIDIGNTNLVIGCIENDKILFKARIATDAIRTSDQYGVEIKNMMEAFGVQVKDIDDCIISSVVPPVFNSVKTGVIKVIRKQPMVVGPGLKTGLNIHMDVPSQVGSDRIVIAVAALAEYEAPMILMDLGTATTIEVVEPNNMYLGGIIFPGVRVSLDALTSRTAQLPGISLDKPKHVIGKEHSGLYAQRHDVRHRRHAGRTGGANRSRAGTQVHTHCHRRSCPVYHTAVQAGDHSGERPAFEGSERHLQEK